jgi:uncharacterized membrane protein YdbT with pleckstrin-like domain
MSMDVSKLSGAAKRYFELIEFDADEELVAEVRKHPFGLIIVYATGFFIGLTVLIVLALVSVYLSGDPLATGADTIGLETAIVVVGIILEVGILIGTAIAGYLYKSNIIFVTSDKLAQVLYTSIFNRKISQLSLGDIQDVTVTQDGIFPRIFNYGTVVIETAGEQNNYIFTYTPFPYQVSKDIVGAHERNLQRYGN